MGTAVWGAAGGVGVEGAVIASGVLWGGCGVKNGFICGLRRLLGRGCSAAGVALSTGRRLECLWGLVGHGGVCGGLLWAGAVKKDIMRMINLRSHNMIMMILSASSSTSQGLFWGCCLLLTPYN